MDIIQHTNKTTWDHIVKSFEDYDVYYLSGYVEGFRLHGDGTPLLLYYKTDSLKGICVLMVRDISDAEFFEEIEPNTLYDAVTPYGYGGFIIEGDKTQENIQLLYNSYIDVLKSKKILSVFYRFHPILNNAREFDGVTSIIDLGRTIHINLTTEEQIWKDFDSKNRTHIRRAKKNNVTIEHGKGVELIDQFIEIYNQTMDGDNADDYYYFSKEFYHSVINDLSKNHEVFYALKDGEIISIAIMLYANKKMHYHLSGSKYEYRNLSPTSLLLYEAACWGVKQGFKTFHLGGGVGSGEDSLFIFKKAFNRYSSNQFSIGYDIVNQESYDKLIEIRKQKDASFNPNSSFFPTYRAK